MMPARAPFPIPSPVTSQQQRIVAANRILAARASADAIAGTLAFLDSADLRKTLQACCQSIANLPARALLGRIRAEARAAELVHNFRASPDPKYSDLSLPVALAHEWLLNQWQVLLLEGGNHSAMTQDAYVAETAIFGCRRFASSRPTWTEASSRLIYTAHNLRRLDTGSLPHFGTIGEHAACTCAERDGRMCR